MHIRDPFFMLIDRFCEDRTNFTYLSSETNKEVGILNI